MVQLAIPEYKKVFGVKKKRCHKNKDMVHTYSGILLSHKKEWNNAICSNMGRPRDYHNNWNKSEKDK